MASHKKIHVVSFGSEGPPHDKGLALGEGVLEEWGKMCLTGGATTYKGYTPRSLVAESPEEAWSVQCYSDLHWMHMYHTVGLGGWRAVIFNKAMESAANGDVVVVHCSNFPKYPCMKYFASRLREYVDATMSFTDFFMPPHDHVGAYCAKEVLDLIPDAALRQVAAHAPMGRGRMIITRVNEKTRRFAQLFLNTLRENPLLLSSYQKTGHPGASYHHHTAEQSVINALAFREGMFPRDWQNSWMMPLRNVGHMPSCGTNMVIKYGSRVEGRMGSPGAGPWKYAIVLQGIYQQPHTPNAIRIFLERNDPDVLVIVSTYVFPKTSLTQLEADAIEGRGQHAGRLVFIFASQPTKADAPTFWESNVSDSNLQRLTSFVGLRYAQELGIPLALKCLSDCFLGMRNVCRELDSRYTTGMPIKTDLKLQARITISDYTEISCRKAHRFEFPVASDFWMFGTVSDLLTFFTMNRDSVWNEGRGVTVRYSAETALMNCWMREIGLSNFTGSNLELLARYFAVAKTSEVEFVWHRKEDSFDRYLKEGAQYLTNVYVDLFKDRCCQPLGQYLWKETVSRIHPE